MKNSKSYISPSLLVDLFIRPISWKLSINALLMGYYISIFYEKQV